MLRETEVRLTDLTPTDRRRFIGATSLQAADIAFERVFSDHNGQTLKHRTNISFFPLDSALRDVIPTELPFYPKRTYKSQAHPEIIDPSFNKVDGFWFGTTAVLAIIANIILDK